MKGHAYVFHTYQEVPLNCTLHMALVLAIVNEAQTA